MINHIHITITYYYDTIINIFTLNSDNQLIKNIIFNKIFINFNIPFKYYFIILLFLHLINIFL